MNVGRRNILESMLVLAMACSLLLLGSGLFHAECDLPLTMGYRYWGRQPGPPQEVTRYLDSCCENHPGCFDVAMLCAQYGALACNGAEAYTKYSVLNRTECTDGYPSDRWCEQTKDEEQWVKCAEYQDCVWDDGVGECVNDSSIDPRSIIVPPVCNHSSLCPIP